MKTIHRIIICCLVLLSSNSILGQKSQYIWAFGDSAGIDFNNLSNPQAIESAMDSRGSCASISDSLGNLLFYAGINYYGIGFSTNVYNSLHQQMPNGDSLKGVAWYNELIILPMPSSANKYYLFTLDLNIDKGLYYSVIDMSLNNGLGDVTTKNHNLNTLWWADEINAIKHANGRDWWVICHQMNSNKFYKLLFTPSGLPQVSSQYVGVIRRGGGGQVKFSPDGNYLGYTYELGGFDLFQFDRCTGNLIHMLNDSLFNNSGFNSGLEFSPNSQFVYVCNSEDIYQYDVTSPNVLSTKTVVAVYDGYQNPPGFGTFLALPQLAPDGKIYITTGNGTFNFHTIDEPDLPGLSCAVNQHSVQLPAFNFNTIPNHPNYFLGALTGSPCDTLVGVGVNNPEEIKISVAPNPITDYFTLSFPVHNDEGTLEVINSLGEIVIQTSVSPWSQFKKLNLRNFPTGLYFCKMKWKEKQAVARVMKIEE